MAGTEGLESLGSPERVVPSVEIASSYSASTGRLTPTSEDGFTDHAGRRTHTTYRDLHNATPSPAGPSSREPRERRPQTPTSPLAGVSSDLGNLALTESQDTATEGSEEVLSLSDGEGDGSEYLYNIRGEELPRAPAYDIRLQHALRNVTGQMADLARSMARRDEARDTTTRFHELYLQTLAASRFTFPKSRTVGFIGDSGVGKSSVINSILDLEGLARSNGDGAACTTVITEFRNVDEEHPNNYTVEADFMDDSEIRELLEELLSAVRKYYTGAFREVTEINEQEKIKSAAMRAWETLRSLFPNQQLDLDFVSQEGEDAVAQIITRLENWVMAAQEFRPGGRDSLQYSVVASHADECMDQLDNLMADSRDGDRPALWPFVKLIRVYLRSPVLRTGLVLADLPGFRDLNYARVRATEWYLRHRCDEVFIVSTIFRCTTDDSIQSIIRRCAPGPPIRIVCTRSEDVNAKETARNSSTTDARQIRDRLSQIEALERSIRRVRSDRRRATGRRSQSLSAEQTILSDEKDAHELELKRLLMSIRNRRVTADLTEKLSHDWGNQTRIFCVSNRLYADNRAMDSEHADEYLALSNIRELRRYCQSVPADAQFRATESFLQNELPATLRSLTLWASPISDTVPVRLAETLRRVVDEAEETLRQTFNSRQSLVSLAQNSLEDQFTGLIKQEIREHGLFQFTLIYDANGGLGDSRNDWRNGAIEASRDWAGWHHSTYAAWCRNYGTHATAKQPYRCWNEEILGRGVVQLSNGWDNMLDVLDDKRRDLKDETSSLFERLCDSIEENDNGQDTVRSLTVNILTRQRCMAHAIDDSFNDLIRATENIKLDAIGGHDSSYMAGVMRPVYNLCREQYGTGSDSRRKQTMNQRLTSSPLFNDFAAKIEGDYKDVLERCLNPLMQKLRDEVANVIHDMRTSVTVEGDQSEAGQNPRLAEELNRTVEVIQVALSNACRVIREVGAGN
ncbi:uncharacterized protein BJX67DRAFT_374065 [Aspergillus lucknowensis]|uniref:Uncharacterized protein n=1 Tax=Aspergillus lucknowensis TaxID=176173 RepID=A0ABR4LLH6_9EURO